MKERAVFSVDNGHTGELLWVVRWNGLRMGQVPGGKRAIVALLWPRNATPRPASFPELYCRQGRWRQAMDSQAEQEPRGPAFAHPMGDRRC